MRAKFLFLILVSVGFCSGPGAVAGPQSLVIKAGKIWTAAGDPVTDGLVVVEQGKITAVGTDVPAPEGAKVLELPGKHVMPGLVDAHSHLGLSLDILGEMDETVSAVAPELRVLDAYNPLAREATGARQAGVTTMLLAPGYGAPITGQMAVVKLLGPESGAAIVNPSAGVKFSLGDEALRSARRPTSHAGLIALVREELDKAKMYDPKSMDVRAEVLHRVVTGQLPVHLYCSTVDEILAAVELVDTYQLKATLVGAREADELANVLAKRSLPVICVPALLLSRDNDLRRADSLAGAGVKVAFASMAPRTDAGDLRTSAILAVKYGMSRETALRAITLQAAETLGVARRLGSIEAGKDADLVILSGDPLELTSHVEMVIVNGDIIYEEEQK